MKIELEAETIQALIAPFVEMQKQKMEVICKVADNIHLTSQRILDIAEKETERNAKRREMREEYEMNRDKGSETEMEIQSIRKKIELLRLKRELAELEAEAAKAK